MFSSRTGVTVVAAGLVLAVGGCGGGADEESDTPGKEPTTAKPKRSPSGELVEWVGEMCASTTALETVRTDSTADLKEIRNPRRSGPNAAEHLTSSYLFETEVAVENVQRDLEDLDGSGVPAADRLRSSWLKKLKAVLPEFDKLPPDAAFQDAEGNAAKTDKLVQSLTPPKPDLPALTKKQPRLKAAYDQAKQCDPDWKPAEETPAPEPSGPLPEAADGEAVGGEGSDACRDGKCEVLVTSHANVTANGLTVDITVEEQLTTFRAGGSVMQLGGQSGEVEFGDDLKITIVRQNEEGAVLKFTPG